MQLTSLNAFCTTNMIDREFFFCRRQRSYKPQRSPYVVNPGSLQLVDKSHIAVDVTNTENNKPFVLDLFAFDDGTMRLKINEAAPLKPRYEVPNTILDLQPQKYVII